MAKLKESTAPLASVFGAPFNGKPYPLPISSFRVSEQQP